MHDQAQDEQHTQKRMRMLAETEAISIESNTVTSAAILVKTQKESTSHAKPECGDSAEASAVAQDFKENIVGELETSTDVQEHTENSIQESTNKLRIGNLGKHITAVLVRKWLATHNIVFKSAKVAPKWDYAGNVI